MEIVGKLTRTWSVVSKLIISRQCTLYATWPSLLKIPISYMLDFTTKASGRVRGLTTGKDSPSLRMVKDQLKRTARNDA